MTAAPFDVVAEDAVALPHPSGQEVGWWAMVLVCATEAALFAYFIAAYFYLGVSNPSWPPAGVEQPKLEKPLIMTLLLVSSSVVLIVAEKQREHGRRAAYRIGTI